MHVRAKVREDATRRKRRNSKFRARVCISSAPQSPSPKLETTRSLRGSWQRFERSHDSFNHLLLFFFFFFRYQDGHNKAWFAILSTTKWLAIRLDMICVIFVPFVVFLAIATHVGTGKQK